MEYEVTRTRYGYETIKTNRDLTGKTLEDFIGEIDDFGTIGMMFVHDSKACVCHVYERNDYPEYWLLERTVQTYEIRRKKRRKSIFVEVYI